VTARFVIRPDSVNTMRVITHDLTPPSRAENGCILCHVVFCWSGRMWHILPAVCCVGLRAGIRQQSLCRDAW